MERGAPSLPSPPSKDPKSINVSFKENSKPGGISCVKQISI